MVYLLLAISCSAMIAIIMRLSSHRVSGSVSMLAMNYLMCMGIAVGGTGLGGLFPSDPALPRTLGLGAVCGVLYLISFVLFQFNVKKNGVVLSSIFMRLGLLVPIVVSIGVFQETPTLTQALGFFIAVAAILLINLERGGSAMKSRAALLLLLLGSGCADSMAKVFDELGSPALAPQFLLYTFLAAFVLCVGLVLLRKERLGPAEVLFGLLIGVPNFFSAKFTLKALEELPAVIVYPTCSVATILVVTLAGVLFFRERLGKRQWLAVAIILAALVLLNL